MTQQPIKWNELTPRKRDTLVAELIFGWTKSKTNMNNWFEPVSGLWKPVDNITVLPHFTTYIEDAWQVVEKMHQTHTVAIFADKEYTVHMIPKVTIRCFNEAITSTAPEAICIAALRAVGCEVVMG